MKELRCCFCGKKIKYGNNTSPIITTKGDLCCDKCNAMVVIPTRLMLRETQQEGAGNEAIKKKDKHN